MFQAPSPSPASRISSAAATRGTTCACFTFSAATSSMSCCFERAFASFFGYRFYIIDDAPSKSTAKFATTQTRGTKGLNLMVDLADAVFPKFPLLRVELFVESVCAGVKDETPNALAAWQSMQFLLWHLHLHASSMRTALQVKSSLPTFLCFVTRTPDPVCLVAVGKSIDLLA